MPRPAVHRQVLRVLPTRNNRWVQVWLLPVTPPLGGNVNPKADEGGEWSGSWHASRQN